MSRITEIKEIKVDGGCKDNPVCLCWRGTNGGMNYWVFYRRQLETLDVSEVGTFNEYVDDLETSVGALSSMGKEAEPGLVLGAIVDKEDITSGVSPASAPGLKGLLMSPDVMMLMNPETWAADGPEFMRVRVQTGSFKIVDTDATKATIELSITLPEIYIQQP